MAVENDETRTNRTTTVEDDDQKWQKHEQKQPRSKRTTGNGGRRGRSETEAETEVKEYYRKGVLSQRLLGRWLEGGSRVSCSELGVGGGVIRQSR